MTNEERRIAAAALMRELGHEFVGRALDEEQFDALLVGLSAQLDAIRTAPPRQRELSRARLEEMAIAIPTVEEIGERQLFSDSIVAGASNPMGLGAQLWHEGDVACLRVTLGRAFEGPPGRAHGGVVAELFDEVLGLVNMIRGVMAYTAQLDISYRAPTPIGEPIIARAWLARHDGRKQFVEGTLHAGDVLVASAKSLFITVDRPTFLAPVLTTEE